MKTKMIALALGVSSLAVFAQDNVKEPEYVNQYFALVDGKLQPLERENLKMQSQMKKRFVYVKGTTALVADGAQSTVQVPPEAHFVVRMDVGDTDPSTMIFLKQFKIEKNEREIIMTTKTANIVTGPNSQQRVGDSSLPVTAKKYGSKSFEIVPSQPLAPGEYVFTPNAYGYGPSASYCFKVAAK